MSENLNDHEERISQTEKPDTIVEANTSNPDDAASKIPSDANSTPKKKSKKKRIAAIVAIIIVAAVAITVAVYPFKFEKVKNECVQMAGQAATGRNYFTLDTSPDAYDHLDESTRRVLMRGVQERTLEAIKYANEQLGFNGSVYSQMLETTALMGRQSEENSKYKVTWTYHPDDGLEVTYTRK